MFTDIRTFSLDSVLLPKYSLTLLKGVREVEAGTSPPGQRNALAERMSNCFVWLSQVRANGGYLSRRFFLRLKFS
jgi:hypothetical protein